MRSEKRFSWGYHYPRSVLYAYSGLKTGEGGGFGVRRGKKKDGGGALGGKAAHFTLSMLAFTKDYYRVPVCLIEKYAHVVISVKK